MKKIAIKLVFFILIALAITGCQSKTSTTSGTTQSTKEKVETVANQQAETNTVQYGVYSEEDYNESYDKEKVTKIQLSKTTSKIDGEGAKESNDVITISSGGTYLVEGEYDGQLLINAKNETVHLILNGVTLTNETSSVIYTEQAEKTIITLAENSTNKLSDGSNYRFVNSEETEPDATIFSKDNLTINGNGTLELEGNYNNGIRSKDNLVITNGNIQIKAKNNALKGKDSISIASGTFKFETNEGDAIQASNDTDPDKGWIAIDGGKYTIQAGNDGFQAETNLSISTADVSIQTGSGYSDEAIDTTFSYKGLKAGGNIIVDDGTFKINSADDSIHSDTAVTINNGTFALTTGDDGIHANTDLIINAGNIDITQSYEGLEGSTITINGGDISVKSADDGMNAAGGSAEETTEEGQFGADTFGSPDSGGDSSKFIEINGGTIFVSADGDGVDSNGDIRMTAGTLVVNGPIDDGNGALDYDGSFTMVGGIFAASGSSGMAMSVSNSSSQAALSIYFNETQQENTLINLSNSSGETILSIQPQKAFSHLVVSSPELKEGENVTLSSGGTDSGSFVNGLFSGGQYSDGEELTTLSLSSLLTSIDESGNAVSGNQMGGPPR